MIAFTSRTLHTPTETLTNPVLLVEAGSIIRLGARDATEVPPNAKTIDFEDCIIAPGFVDIHIHGSAGYDVMQSDQTPRSAFEAFLTRRGVTSYYPTTVSAPLSTIEAALGRLADAIEGKGTHVGAQPLGIHLEGPFLSYACRGVHPPENLISPTIEVFEKFWQAARGHIRVVTIAPELEGAQGVILEATRRGVCVSIGHSDASLQSAQAGVSSGARHATHTFNAMRRLDHRDPGILAEVLTNNKLTADVIADGIHVDPTMVKLLQRAKGSENLVLITDAISATGMPDGRYLLGSLEVELKDGKCLSGGRLAGSVLTMDRAMRNLMEFAEVDLPQALRAATMNPARVAGAQKKGFLAPGADADLVVLTPSGEVRAAIIKGAIVQ